MNVESLYVRSYRLFFFSLSLSVLKMFAEKKETAECIINLDWYNAFGDNEDDAAVEMSTESLEL